MRREPYSDGQRAAAAADSYDEYDTYDYSGRDYEESPSPRRKLPLAIAILSLAVIGTAGAYGYRVMFAGEKQVAAVPPVIRADTSPKKVASSPQANDKQIQERVTPRSPGEQMLSREEQPLTIKDPAARPLPSVSPSGEPPAASSAAAMADPSAARPPAAPPGLGGEPRKVKTVTIRPDGAANDAPPPVGSTGRTAAQPASPVPATPAAPRPAQPATPGAESKPAPAQSAPARPQPSQQVAVATPPPGYVVQLSAQKSEADAQASFRAMQAKYPSVLSGRKSIIRRKENASKGVYFGAQVGPFASREEAHQLCEQLKAAGGACFVEKN